MPRAFHVAMNGGQFVMVLDATGAPSFYDALGVPVVPTTSVDGQDEIAVPLWWSSPVLPPVTPPSAPRTMTTFAFRQLFTDAEKIAFEEAKALPGQPGAVACAVQADFDALTGDVNLDDPPTAKALNTLAALGVLTPARVAVILGGG